MDKHQITREQCLAKSHELQNSYGWKLITTEALSEAAMERIEHDPNTELQPTIIATYAGQALYPALLGKQNPAQREQAARELANFLHRVLCKRWPSLANSSSDLVQASLERILKQIDTCRRPETVLAFAAMKLRTVVQKKFRQLSKEQKFDSIDAMHEQGPKQLEAVYLRYCADLTVEETAERLGMTRKNVSVLTSRGLKFLRERKDDLIL